MSRQATSPLSDKEALQRADELLRQMTIEEKAMQLSSVAPLALLDREGSRGYWGQCANSFIFFHPAIYLASVLGSRFKRLFHSPVLNA